MKAESAQFAIDRLIPNGMSPVFLWRFINAGLFLSTVSFTVTNNPPLEPNDDYLPYILNFAPVEFGLETGGNFGSIASCSVTLARVTATNALLTNVQANTPVEVDLAFYKNANILKADRMPIGRFIFESVTDITQAQFTVNLIADERKLITLPKTRFADVSVVPDDNKKEYLPIILGDFRNANSGTNGNPAWEAKDHNCAPCLLANDIHNSSAVYGVDTRTNIGEWIAGETLVGNGSNITIAKVYQYDSGMDILIPAELQRTISPYGISNAFQTFNVTGESFAPSSRVAKIRMSADRYAARICEIDAPTNTLTDQVAASKYVWKNCTDEDTTNVSRVEAGHTPAYNILAVGWLKEGALSTTNSPPTNPLLAWYHFWITNGDKTTGGGTRLTVKAALRSNGVLDSGFQIDITSTTTFPYYVVAGPITSATTVGNTTFASIGWNWHLVYLQITCTGVTTTSTQFAEFGSVGVEFACLDDIVKRTINSTTQKGILLGKNKNVFFPNPPKFWRSFYPQAEGVVPTKTEFVTGTTRNVFADFYGPTATTTNPTLFTDIWSPAWMAYAFLTDILGYSTAQIDETGFAHQDNFNQAFNPIHLGIVIDAPRSAQDILRDIAFQGNALLFYSGEGKWKLQPRARYLIDGGFSAPITQFSDTASDYIIRNLTWQKIEPEFNFFRVKYLYDYARTVFAKQYEKSYTGTLPNNRAMDDIEAFYLRDATSTQNFLDIYSGFLTKTKRLISFETTLAASVLELGDYIKASHVALPDNTPRYQINKISYTDDIVKIEALEV